MWKSYQCGILAGYLFTLSVKGTFSEVIPKCHNIGFLVLDTLCDNKLLLFINVAHGNGIYNHGLSSTSLHIHITISHGNVILIRKEMGIVCIED